MKITYIILYLVLNSTTGEPLSVHAVSDDGKTVTQFESLDDCEKRKMAFGPQIPKDGKVAVYVCATEKEITEI